MLELRIIILYTILLVPAWQELASGHVFPEHAEPEIGATLTASPMLVRIWFDGALDPTFSTLRVQNAIGKQVDNRDSRVNASDATLLEVGIPSLSSGNYRVIWRVVALDGHRTEGEYVFTIE